MRPSRPNILFILVDQMRYAPVDKDTPKELEQLYQILRFQPGSLDANPYKALFPGFELLRKNAVTLQNHMASSAACVPSRATIMTGQYSARSGVTQTEGMFKVDTDPAFPWLPQDGVPTMGDWFRAAGYETHYFGRWDLSNPPVGSLEPWGFGDWEASYPSDQRFGTPNLGVFRDKGYTPLIETFLKRKALGADANIINSNNPTNASFAQRPWLAVASFVNPHDIGAYPFPWKPGVQPVPSGAPGGAASADSPVSPYGVPPAGTRSNPPQYGNFKAFWQVPLNPGDFKLTGVTPPANWSEALLSNGKPSCQHDYSYKFQLALKSMRGQPIANQSPYPFMMQDDAWSWYQGYLKFYLYLQYLVNLEVSAVLTTLHETGLADNTIVVFTSDHGELAGAHGGQLEKWHNMYRESVHVPAIVSSPRVNPQQDTMRVVNTHTTHVDWVPTLLGLAGYSASDQASLARFIQGHTVAPLAGKDLSEVLQEPTRQTPRGVLFVSDDHITAPLDTSYLPDRYRLYLKYTAELTSPEGSPSEQHPLMAPGPVVQPNHVQAYFDAPWKLARYWDPLDARNTQWELYNLEVDRTEDHNLVGWDKTTGAPVVRQDVVTLLGLSVEQTTAKLDELRRSLNQALLEAGYTPENLAAMGVVVSGLTPLEARQYQPLVSKS